MLVDKRRAVMQRAAAVCEHPLLPLKALVFLKLRFTFCPHGSPPSLQRSDSDFSMFSLI